MMTITLHKVNFIKQMKGKNKMDNKKTDYPLSDSEFMDIDDKLYILIQKTLEIKYNINEDKHLHNWYCDIRSKLCEQIHNKKIELNK